MLRIVLRVLCVLLLLLLLRVLCVLRARAGSGVLREAGQARAVRHGVHDLLQRPAPPRQHGRRLLELVLVASADITTSYKRYLLYIKNTGQIGTCCFHLLTEGR